MNTFSKILLLFLPLWLFSCSVESVTEQPSHEDEMISSEMSSSAIMGNEEFFVSESMLSKFLRLVYRGKEVDLIEPVVEGVSILAYYVQFSNGKGWALIAADSRVTPILSEAPSGALNLDGDGPVGGILGTLKNVEDARNNPEANVHSIWKFLFPEMYATKTKSFANTKSSRVFITGMWMPVDTVFAYDTVFSGRTIATKWGQRFPWDEYTPRKDALHIIPTAVGCGPVAVGQILYRYYYLTSGVFNIPDSVSMVAGYPNFETYTSNWSGFALDSTDSNNNAKSKAAKFLAWVGNQMNSDYDYETETEIEDVKSFLHNHLQFSERTSYDYYIAHSYVLSNIPVLMDACSTNLDSAHYFIIDACKEIKYQARVRYIFDYDHPVTQEEYERLPNWMFMEPGPGSDYDPDKEETWLMVPIDIMDDTYFLMNWGYDGEYDEATYIARSKHYFYNEDYSYLYYSTDHIYDVSWKAKNTKYTIVQHMLYNFRRFD